MFSYWSLNWQIQGFDDFVEEEEGESEEILTCSLVLLVIFFIFGLSKRPFRETNGSILRLKGKRPFREYVLIRCFFGLDSEVRSFLDHDRPYIPAKDPISPDTALGKFVTSELADFVHLDKEGAPIVPRRGAFLPNFFILFHFLCFSRGD